MSLSRVPSSKTNKPEAEGIQTEHEERLDARS